MPPPRDLPAEHIEKVQSASWGQVITGTPCPTCGVENVTETPLCFSCGSPMVVVSRRSDEPLNEGVLTLFVLSLVGTFLVPILYFNRASDFRFVPEDFLLYFVPFMVLLIMDFFLFRACFRRFPLQSHPQSEE